MCFSPATIEAIGSYVYALTGEDDKIFYIGKGEGNRVFSHVEEVRREMDSNQFEGPDYDSEGRSLKKKRIAEILKQERTPSMYIIRESLTPEQALLIEAALISVLDWQLKVELTNQVAGHGTAHFGLKTVEELEATKGEPFRLTDLPNLAVGQEVVAINVNNRWREVVAKTSSLLDIAKGSWRINQERAQNCRYAIIHANGIVRGVFEIEEWQSNGNRRFSFKPANIEPLPDPQLSQKNASSLFGVSGRGAQNPIRYVKFSG